MDIWVVMEIVEYKDGLTDRFLDGVYSSRENAVKAIKDYQYSFYDANLYGKLVDEDICDGKYCCARTFYTDNDLLENVMLIVNRPTYILDNPISRKPLTISEHIKSLSGKPI